MKTDNSLIFTLEAGSAIALLHACAHGQTTLQPNGLHVAKIADDQIALTILAVCAVSCVLATVLLQRIHGTARSNDVWAFGAAVLLGGLATSAIANGAGSINGMSPGWISGPAMLWLIGLSLMFVQRASTRGQKGDLQGRFE
jgi:hypothetical protein